MLLPQRTLGEEPLERSQNQNIDRHTLRAKDSELKKRREDFRTGNLGG